MIETKFGQVVIVGIICSLMVIAGSISMRNGINAGRWLFYPGVILPMLYLLRITLPLLFERKERVYVENDDDPYAR